MQRNSIPIVAGPCAISKDYLLFALSLERASTHCPKRRTESPSRPPAPRTDTNQDTLVNSRIATRPAKALAASGAFVRASALSPAGGAPDRRESEDRLSPGESRA
jgi:hypothetical protein